MRVLVTTSRLPCAIDEIRKLGRQGHEVIATDTFRAAPGSHSRYVTASLVTSSPRRATAKFIAEIKDAIVGYGVELVLPSFEEVFYLARYRDELPSSASYFFPTFGLLARLHDKAAFLDVARDLGILVPWSAVVTSRDELRSATGSLERFFARPVYSRGGVDLLTNAGPLAGSLRIEDCAPTRAEPWIVQEFVSGEDLCTYSVVHHGKLSGHAAYIHPRQIEHAGGIVFESVYEPECIRIAQAIAEATGYHGQMSLDFMKTQRGMVLIECNPRPTAGIHVMSAEDLEGAIFDVGAKKLRVAEPGVRRKYSVALVRDMLLHAREAREDLRALFSDAKEVVADPNDLGPALYQVLSYGHVIAYKLRNVGHTHKNTSLMAAYFDDVCWNGEPIP
jgi:predicted ATP-grasp superfamily ATP-dependent carboligase